jgi:glycosyltransferase involved in cell wall biosynthesis
MDQDRPLISIVIPTRERIETLRSTLSTALDQKSQRIEVLVADNASRDGTAEFVRSIVDARLRYVNPARRLSMSANWDFALLHARGAYIVIIGDDDAVVPGAIDRLILDMGRCRSEVYSWPKHVYVWPDSGRNAYVESIAPQTGPRWLDLDRRSRSVLTMGGWGHYSLPSMYHSLVSRRIPDQMRERYGRVYHSAMPDVFMTMCIPAFAASAWDVGYSVTVHGRSSKSNGWVVTNNQQPTQIKRFLSEYGEYRPHPTLYPAIPIIANLTPDAVLVARDLFADHYAEATFGYEAMWALICREAHIFKWRIAPWDVVRMRAGIRRYHHFGLLRFLAYLAWHAGHAIHSRIAKRGTRTSAADDIGTFVREIGRA